MENPSDQAVRTPAFSYRLLFERNPLPMWVCDAHTQAIRAVNEAALARYGYSRQEFAGLTVLDLHHDGEGVPLPAPCAVAPALPPETQRLRHRSRSGEWFEVEIVTEAIEFDGTPALLMLAKDLCAQRPAEHGLTVNFCDGTEQNLAQERLRGERETLAAVVSASNDAIVMVDAEGRITMFNPAAERVFRWSRAAMLGQALEVLLPERYRIEHTRHRQRFVAGQRLSPMMGLGLVKGLRADNQEIDLEGVITLVTVQQQPILIASMRDVTERVRLDGEHARSRKQLSELTQKLMQQEKILVNRLAQALHDQLGQTMAAVRMVHEAMVAMQTDLPDAATARLRAQLGALINQANREVRQVLIDLRPALLDEQGLAAALDNELRNRALTMPQVNIVMLVRPETALLRWPAEVEYSAFMVAREALDNALRHSGAGSVTVQLAGSSALLTLDVTDEGVGMGSAVAPPHGHLGILGMQERASAVGASVRIESAAQQGTHVAFYWQQPRHWEPSL